MVQLVSKQGKPSQCSPPARFSPRGALSLSLTCMVMTQLVTHASWPAASFPQQAWVQLVPELP